MDRGEAEAMAPLGPSISIAQYREVQAAGLSLNGRAARSRRNRAPEEDLHRACFEWVSLQTPRHKILRWTFHTPNGGKRPKGEAGKLKALGVKPGFPDVHNPMTRGRWKGFAVELKAPGNKPTPDQEAWLQALAADGYLTGVAFTLDEFVEYVCQYLRG